MFGSHPPAYRFRAGPNVHLRVPDQRNSLLDRLYAYAALPLPNLCFQVADRPALALGLGQDGGAERMFVAFAVPRELIENPATIEKLFC